MHGSDKWPGNGFSIKAAFSLGGRYRQTLITYPTSDINYLCCTYLYEENLDQKENNSWSIRRT